MQYTAEAPSLPRRIYREPDLAERIPVHATTRLRWEQRGLFPKRIMLGPHTIGWYADEVDEWIASRQRATVAGMPSPNPRTARKSR